ncbi:tpr domain containing protein [Grosmannia clavigera kw1407]|uniref:Tpr domain containing protein n=1 Tax=Grosmannia clavigera (strain kw1407 / UAMH 11150) TaxID=655863 RepID=F0XC06_GROCL|nr:tpr domain containing protein [Grosmannia clavigera kw1407]EFX04566.1 tpr domain containing protein [Grosmannia clavigera kw1407]
MRAIFTPFRGQSLKNLYQKSPEETVLALAVLVAFVFIFAYIARIYYTYFNSRQFTRYPQPVAKYLRRALYFSNYSPDPKRALKNYKLALEQCDELGLDPFSDDVMGIRIQLASWLEKVQNYEAAIKILELLLSDCKRWVEQMERSVDTGSTKDSGKMSARLPAPRVRGTATEDEDMLEKDRPSDVETLWARRSRILQKAIGISVKLGELYADEHVLNANMAHERLVWAVDAALQEFQRRSVSGVKTGEGEWMSPKEMGAALESLGHSYESRSQFHLALPLFFQALRLCKDPCHSAVINKPSSKPPTQEEARKAYLETAQRWALNAQQHAADAAGEERTPECDEACVVSLCNLGDIAAMLGDAGEARRRFRQGRAMSEKLQFAAGVEQAEAGLRRLS